LGVVGEIPRVGLLANPGLNDQNPFRVPDPTLLPVHDI